METLDDVEHPEEAFWNSGALATDNSIYYMSAGSYHIIILNPDKNRLSSVRDGLGGRYNNYSGTVVVDDDFLYVIPNESTRTVEYNPADSDTKFIVSEGYEKEFEGRNGVLAGDVYI